MAYTIPTPANVKARFPEFVDVADETIQPFIDAAGIWVDTFMWTETDYYYAIVYLTAHYLALYQRAIFASSTGGTGGTGGEVIEGDLATFVSEIKFEDFDVKFGQDKRQSTSGGSSGGGGVVTSSEAIMEASPYGLLFVQLRDRNVPHMAVLR